MTLPGSFSFEAPHDNFDIKVETRSSNNCTSLPTTLAVKTQPSVGEIISDDLCINLGNTPTVTFRALSSPNTTSYIWSYPSQWTKISGGQAEDDSITLILDENTPGDVCVVPSNNGCSGEELCLEIPRNTLDVSLTRQMFGGGSVGAITATAISPVKMTWTYGSDENDVKDCAGPLYDLNSEEVVLQSTFFYYPGITHASLKMEDLETGCERCLSFKLSEINELSGQGGAMGRKTKILSSKFDLNIHPNPVRDYINIEVPSSEKIEGIVLVNAKGKQVFKKKPMTNTEKIDVSKYPSGMYFIYVMTAESGFRIKKVIID